MTNKFYHMLRAGTLPEMVMQQWNKSTTRDSQTKLINQCFTKVGKNYQVKDEYLVPTNYKKKHTTERQDSATDEQSGYGRLLFRKKYNLDEQELDEPVRQGEMRMFKSGAVMLYAAVNVKMCAGVAKKTSEDLSTNEIAMDQETALAFAMAHASMEPDVNLGPGTQAPQAPSSSARAPSPAMHYDAQIEEYLRSAACQTHVQDIHCMFKKFYLERAIPT